MRSEITEFSYTHLLMDLIYFCHVNIYTVFFSTFQCPYCIYALMLKTMPLCRGIKWISAGQVICWSEVRFWTFMKFNEFHSLLYGRVGRSFFFFLLFCFFFLFLFFFNFFWGEGGISHPLWHLSCVSLVFKKRLKRIITYH